MFHGIACVAGGVSAAAGRRHNHGLASGQADRAFVGVLEGAVDLGHAVNPGFELARDAEVVHRCTDHHHVSRQQL